MTVDITKLFKGWQEGAFANNGFYICVAPSQPQTSFEIYTREKTDIAQAPPKVVIIYHTATLGDPTECNFATFSFHLISPDNTTLTTPPYRFTW